MGCLCESGCDGVAVMAVSGVAWFLRGVDPAPLLVGYNRGCESHVRGVTRGCYVCGWCGVLGEKFNPNPSPNPTLALT